jgi:NarL family two-component system response regulator LiaR
MINLLLVDDHTVVRQGLRFLLSQQLDIRIVGECADGASAVAEVERLLPTVVLLDLLLPDQDGVATLRSIKTIAPITEVIILTSYFEDDLIFRAIKSGARSYLLKDASPQQIIDTVRAAARGESILPPIVAARVLQEMQQQRNTPLDVLSSREREVLTLIARGRSNREIAGVLTLSEQTIKSHVSNILSKLHLADRTQAAIFALQQRLVPLQEALNPDKSQTET